MRDSLVLCKETMWICPCWLEMEEVAVLLGLDPLVLEVMNENGGAAKCLG